MSWTDIYPFLNDDMVGAYQAGVTSQEKEEIDQWLGVAKKLNCREGDHLVVTTLSRRPEMTSASTSEDGSDNSPPGGQWLGYLEFQKLLEGAAELSRTRLGIVLRVYLAADLEDLADQLIEAGCEVILMKASGKLEHADSLWRFLAMEEDRWITFTDSSFGRDMIFDVHRTEQLRETALGFWRAPYVIGGDTERLKASSYRPIDSAHFGLRGGLPGQLLLRALIWHCKKETMEVRCIEEDGNPGTPIEGCKWPGNGFDSWFLLSAVFPRAAFSGVLTFLIWQRKSISHWYALDIEYVTWANSSSELMMTRKVITEKSPWTELPEDSGIAIRPEARVIRRKRKRIYEGYEFPKLDKKVVPFEPFEGNLNSLLNWSRQNISEKWWIDFASLLIAGKAGVELFLDRRYDEADVAVCGYYFQKISREIAQWAGEQGLSSEKWSEGMIRKLPKLEGPITLWRTEFSRKFSDALLQCGDAIGPELLLAAWMEQDKANVMGTTAGRMGWWPRL